MAKDQQTPEPMTNEGLLAALSLILERLGPDRASTLDGDKLADAISRGLHEANLASERRQNPSNPTPPRISAFSYPEGDRARPKPFLTRKGLGNLEEDEEVKVFHNYGRCDTSLLTPFEIEVCNALIKEMPGRDARRESRGGRWYAQWDRNNAKNLHIITPAIKVDERSEVMGSTFVQICMELAKGEKAAEVNDLVQRVMQMEAELARLRPAAAPPAVAVPA